jgi:hypothetical protein
MPWIDEKNVGGTRNPQPSKKPRGEDKRLQKA